MSHGGPTYNLPSRASLSHSCLIWLVSTGQVSESGSVWKGSRRDGAHYALAIKFVDSAPEGVGVYLPLMSVAGGDLITNCLLMSDGPRYPPSTKYPPFGHLVTQEGVATLKNPSVSAPKQLY